MTEVTAKNYLSICNEQKGTLDVHIQGGLCVLVGIPRKRDLGFGIDGHWFWWNGKGWEGSQLVGKDIWRLPRVERLVWHRS